MFFLNLFFQEFVWVWLKIIIIIIIIIIGFIFLVIRHINKRDEQNIC
jgi:uncharacterized membrane protein SirB2